MYIEPNTTIKLLHNVPLDNTYEHTILFSSADEQANYFASLTKHNLSNNTYQRVQRGVAKIALPADSCYDCNYLMFQNTNYGSKWFYAFIQKVEYVNNAVCEVTFELDIMQTWLFDFALKQCFVEREHTPTDVIGEHIEPEPLETGEYVFNSYAPITQMSDMCICIAIVDVDNATDGTLYDGIYGSAKLWVYDSTDITSVNAKISEYTQKPEAIIGTYMFPKLFLGGVIPETHLLGYGATATRTFITLNGVEETDTLNGYLPKNKKLYTYPYNFFHVDNASGGELSLRYEFFANGKPVFQIAGTVTQPVTAIIRPCSYKGVQGYTEITGYTTLNTESIQLNNYPVCSWNTDSYKMWVAQNSAPIALNTIASIGQTAVGAQYSTQPNAVIGASAIGQVSNILSQMYQASIRADISKGTFNNGGVNTANFTQQFYGGRCSVNAKFAKIIDDYFTRYGYACNVVKIPNIESRPHWNYVKTIGCVIVGSVPCDDMRAICNIHDKGITYWKNGNEIGDYSLDNSPE